MPAGATIVVIVSCYGTALVATLLSLLGISFAIVFFTALAFLAVAVSYRHHRKAGPVVLAALGLALILWVMYGSYNAVTELAGFALLVGGAASDWRARAHRKETEAGFSWVDPEALVARFHEEPRPVIVDVREPDEFAGELGRLPDARNIPLSGFLKEITQLVPLKDREMVLVCRTQMRSAKAAAALDRAGFRNVGVLRGGMVEWRRRRLPTEDRASSSRLPETQA